MSSIRLALAATLLTATAGTIAPADAAVVYCTAVGFPVGCVVRTAPVVVAPRPVVVAPRPVVVAPRAVVATPRVGVGVGAPGVGRPGYGVNRGGPVNRVGVR